MRLRADRHNVPAMPSGTTIPLHTHHLDSRVPRPELVGLATANVLVQSPHEFERDPVTSAPTDATDAQPRCDLPEP